MAFREQITLGEIVMTKVYTTATLPANGNKLAGTVVAVSDAGAGDNWTLVINDGTDWIDLTTGAAVVA